MENIKEVLNYQLQGEKDRLDKLLSELMEDTSRSTVQKLIKDECVLVDGKVEKANYKAKGSELITVHIPFEKEIAMDAENIPLDIIYEDDDLLIVNKPINMVVHPSKGHPHGTLVNALLYYLGNKLSKIGEVNRPGIVHRIDKDTSGLIVVAKNDLAHQALSLQLADHSMGRTYVALVNGQIESPKGIIEFPLKRDSKNRLRYAVDKEGKYALTEFQVLDRFEEASLVEASLKTGRTHQIRVHLEAIGHPIIGDPVYRNGINNFKGQLAKLHDGQYLHAQSIHFKHPTSHEEMTFSTGLPERFEEIIKTLTKE